MIRFACPKCNQVLEASDGSSGQVVACPKCDQEMRIPVAPAPPARDDSDEEDLPVLEEVNAALSRRSSRRKDRSLGRASENPFGKLDDDEYLENAPAGRTKGRRRNLKKLRESLPPEAEKLGPMRSVHDGPTVLPILGMILFGGIALVGLLCFPFAFFVSNIAPAIPAVFALPLGTLGFLRCFWGLGRKVITFEKGFVQINRGKFLVVPWKEVDFVWQAVVERKVNGISKGTSYTYTIKLRDGIQATFNNSLANIKRLGQILMHESSQVVYPRAMKAYNKGKTVHFGSLGVSQDGLHHGSSVLEWEDIDAVEIKEGYVSVSKSGKWFNWCNIAASAVPNIYVFTAMVNQIVGIGRR
jgi:hypothetical protein